MVKLQHASYLHQAFSSAGIRSIADRWQSYGDRLPEGAVLMGTGLSGALIVPRLADMLERKWCIVRKPTDTDNPTDGTHSSLHVEGWLSDVVIFVDDCISSGKTLRRTWKRYQDAYANARLGGKPWIAAAFMYGPGRVQILADDDLQRMLSYED